MVLPTNAPRGSLDRLSFLYKENEKRASFAREPKSQQVSDKKRIRLEKNRESARLSRRRKKQYQQMLDAKATELLTELLDANPMPEIARDRKDGSAVESAEQQNKRERTWDLNEGYTAEKTE